MPDINVFHYRIGRCDIAAVWGAFWLFAVSDVASFFLIRQGSQTDLTGTINEVCQILGDFVGNLLRVYIREIKELFKHRRDRSCIQ